MATPTITGVSPSRGPSGGDALVVLQGTNFNPPTLIPGQSIAYEQPTAIVTFEQGGQVIAFGSSVRVADPTVASCLAPRLNPGVYDVALTNLDPLGVPRSNERAVLPGAYTAASPLFGQENETDLARLVRMLLQDLKRQLLVKEVNFAVQTDYDPTTGDELHITKFSQLPGLSLVGPGMRENRFYSINEQPTVQTGDDGEGNPTDFDETRVPYTVDLLFTVVVASDNKVELLNLMHAFVAYMHKNKFLSMPRSTTAGSSSVRYEMDFEPGGQPKYTSLPNNSNVRSFTAEMVIRGFDVEYLDGLAAGTTDGLANQSIVNKGKIANEVVMDPTEQLDVSSRVGPSP